MYLPKARWSSIAIAVAFLPVLGVACNGQIGGEESATGSGGASAATGGGATAATIGGAGATSGVGATGGSGGTTGAGSSATGVTSLPPTSTGGGGGDAGTTRPPTPESAGVMALRRVTNREYDHIVASLLGDTTAPGQNFPLDGPSVTGFEAPNGVADLNVQYYFQTAEPLAEAALAAKKFTIPCTNPTAAQETTCAGQFVDTFGRRAYRRPVAAAEKTDLLTVFSDARKLGLVFNEAVTQMVKAMLQSPNFLYHWELGPTKPTIGSDGLVALTSHQIASRLAMTLWEDMPDDTLLTAADNAQLASLDQVEQQATRMLADPRASNALFNFHEQMLLQVAGHVTDLVDITKTSPLFTAGVKQALAGEFGQFVSSVFAPSGDGTLNSLFTAPYAFINADTAPIYGVTATGTALTKVMLDPKQRAGILTQTAFLASEADPSTDNPVRRGLAVYINLLCGEVGPVPDVVPPLNPPSATLSTRDRFDEHAQAACAVGCHNLFDPPGFAFENYDAIGAYRTTEAGKPVDATGTLTTPGGASIAFTSAVDLSQKLAQNTEVMWCMDRQWFRYMLGRPEGSAEQGSLEAAYTKGLSTPGYSLRDMLITMAGSTSFRYRAPTPGEVL